LREGISGDGSNRRIEPAFSVRPYEKILAATPIRRRRKDFARSQCRTSGTYYETLRREVKPVFSTGAAGEIPGEGRSRGPPFGLAGDSGRGMSEARKRAGRGTAVADPRPIRQPAYIPSIFSAYRSMTTFFLIFMVGVRMPLSMVNSGTIRTFFTVSKEASSRFLSATSVSMS
jgi:hypothetical protein